MMVEVSDGNVQGSQGLGESAHSAQSPPWRSEGRGGEGKLGWERWATAF